MCAMFTSCILRCDAPTIHSSYDKVHPVCIILWLFGAVMAAFGAYGLIGIIRRVQFRAHAAIRSCIDWCYS